MSQTCFLLFVSWVLRAAMPSSTTAAPAAAIGRTGHEDPAASSQQSAVGTSNRPTWMLFFLELEKRSLPSSTDVLRSFFDATLDRGKPAGALKGKRKTCQHRITLRQDRMCAHYFECVIAVACSLLSFFFF